MTWLEPLASHPERFQRQHHGIETKGIASHLLTSFPHTVDVQMTQNLPGVRHWALGSRALPCPHTDPWFCHNFVTLTSLFHPQVLQEIQAVKSQSSEKQGLALSLQLCGSSSFYSCRNPLQEDKIVLPCDLVLIQTTEKKSPFLHTTPVLTCPGSVELEVQIHPKNSSHSNLCFFPTLSSYTGGKFSPWDFYFPYLSLDFSEQHVLRMLNLKVKATLLIGVCNKIFK